MSSPGFDRAQAAWDRATPPDYALVRCTCGHTADDHEDRPEYSITPCLECDCGDFTEYTADDAALDAADRAYSEWKEGL